VKNPGVGVHPLLVFLAGLGTGIGVVLFVQFVGGGVQPPPSHYLATLYLPIQDNAGQPFSQDQWREAVGLLVSRHGGATVGKELEGWWVEADTGKTFREPVRVVVVTLPRDQAKLLERTAREVGQKLGQDAVYYRLEEAHVRIVSTREKSQNRE
jgi:hypothetical protein